MQDIENLAIETYQKNLEYLSNKHPNITQMLTVLDMAINNGDYTPEYELEYLDGYFDVKTILTGKYLYSENSATISQELARRVDYRKDSYVFEGLPIYNFSDEEIEKFDETGKVLNGVLPLMRYYFLNTDPKDYMKNIDKYIFIGAGLGLHIPEIHNKISASIYLIIEDNLELFKLSLFTTKYYEVAKDSQIYFSIADDENTFSKVMNNFLEDDFFSNRYLKYFYLSVHSNNKLKQIQNNLITQNFIFFPYRAELDKYIRALDYLNNGYRTINLSSKIYTKIFHNKPILLIAAGPSFQKNLEWVKKHHKKFVIIAVSATIRTLCKHGITPDIVTHLDGSQETIKFFEDMDVKSFLKNSIMLFGSNVPPQVREMFDKNQIYSYEEGTNYIKDFGSLSTPCIGSFSLMLSLILDAKNLYLLGLDLAVNQDTGDTHSSDHTYNQRNDMSEKDKLSETMDHVKNLFPIEGNFRDVVYTNSLLHTSVKSLYVNIPRVKEEHQNIYNMNDGANINKAIPTDIVTIETQEYKEIDKNQIRTEIQDMLNNNSVISLSPEDVSSMKKRLDYACKINDLLKEYKNSVSHSNSDKYMYDLLGLVSDILRGKDRESLNLSYIYLNYFKYTLSIALDIINTKGLKNEKRHIKKIDKMLQEEMFNISNLYKDAIEKFIKERC